jgi:glycosyltransferase involved in cell wall biosynthesis
MALNQRNADVEAYQAQGAPDGATGPVVSVCIPAFNAERWIRRAVVSALEQSFEELEVVVVDNASTDGTIERVLEIGDPRVRVYSNSTNLGVYRNFNRSIALARGRYVKFLCADDLLYPECVEEMLRPFELDDRVGLVFSPRDIELDDPTNPYAIKWKAKHESTHQRFGALGPVNDGRALLAIWLADQLASNWIGEPSNVMMSRECLGRVGTFPFHHHESGEVDLWVRAMLFHSVGFVDRPLSSFLVRAGSLTSANRESNAEWLDRLWLLEGLMNFEEVRREFRVVRWLRAKAVARAVVDAIRGRRVPEDGKLDALRAYAAHRLRGGRDSSPLYGSADDRGQPGETVEVAPQAV